MFFLERICDSIEIKTIFESLYDRNGISDFKNNTIDNNNVYHQSYFQKQLLDQQMLYDSKVLGEARKIYLAKGHMRESIVWQEEAIRQHGFCRKFTKDDYLYNLLRHYHDM